MNTEVFLKVVKSGSFKAAAQELGYTQAGISYIINAMEEELGIILFVRDYGGVRLSAEGNEVLFYMEQINNYERLLSAKANELKRLDSGSVSVRSFNSVSIHWLPGIIEKFNKDYPNITVELVSCEDDSEAERMVWDQNVDCGFFVMPLRSELETISLKEEPFLVSLSEEHPLASLKRVPLRELRRYPYIKMTYTDGMYLEQLFRLAGGEPESRYAMDNDYAALAMASKNFGYCIFPKMMLQGLPFPLKHLETDPSVTMEICIGTRSFETCSHATKEFMKYAADWVRECTK